MWRRAGWYKCTDVSEDYAAVMEFRSRLRVKITVFAMKTSRLTPYRGMIRAYFENRTEHTDIVWEVQSCIRSTNHCALKS
jgi:hypothetical protein